MKCWLFPVQAEFWFIYILFKPQIVLLIRIFIVIKVGIYAEIPQN